ncbi:hypothetical protein ACWOFR_12550 [Carnobacterium gallinarum]|uniref:hypothetical protein n=1 Tax=Carnobacterium gallinarum TaxID=2749 RepID=UPI000556DE79|nr:hypothetical protein [Carnobacterium gallinarum]
MHYLYANLLGEWTCLNLDPSSSIDGIHPDLWLTQHPELFFEEKFISIVYAGVHYQIHPTQIQTFKMAKKW